MRYIVPLNIVMKLERLIYYMMNEKIFEKIATQRIINKIIKIIFTIFLSKKL